MFVEGKITALLLERILKPENNSTGGIASFMGVVRNDSVDNSRVSHIEFGAQVSLAKNIAGEITDEAIKKFGITGTVILHSLGRVAVGETCFAVVVKGAHRKECFAALPYIVDAVKSRCPIFGKEITKTGAHRWKQNT